MTEEGTIAAVFQQSAQRSPQGRSFTRRRKRRRSMVLRQTTTQQRNLQQQIKRGLIIIDKVPGPTSHEVAAWVKKLMNIDHVGHGGTLDPHVTGVLPVCLEDSTKIVQALLDSGKESVTIMQTHEDVSETKILEILNMFVVEIYQRPPLRSAVSRRLRTRMIYRIDYLEGSGRNSAF